MATFAQAAAGLLDNLCTGLGLESESEEFHAVQEFFLQDWGKQEIPSHVPYASSIGDDHSPFEYSVAFAPRGSDLRLLVEMQGQAPGALPNQRAALTFNGQLARRFGADFERFEAIKELFLPESPNPPFSLWHAVCLNRAQHDFKVYLNPQVRGVERAGELVDEAFSRFGLTRGARAVVSELTSRPSGRGVLNYFSLDLSKAPGARVKVYFQHPQATAQQLDEMFRLAPSHQPGDVIEFCRAMVGSDGPYVGKAVTSCFSFVQGQDQPLAATFHFPIAHYVPNDLVTVERVAAYLASKTIDADVYRRVMHAFAMRPLNEAAGIQSYASFRREESGIRFTAYLSPELFRGKDAHASGSRLRAVAEATEPAPGSVRR